MDKRPGFFAGIVKGFLWVYSGLTFFVLIYMTYNSLRTRPDILSNTFGVPKVLNFDNFIKLFVQDKFYRNFFNSAFILFACLVLITLISSMTAYAIGRYKFKFRSAVRIYFLIGLMFPAQLSIVPLFLIMKNLNLINNFASVILILSAGISMPVLLLTDFFAKLPSEIYEAAVIDGAGEWKTFYRIMFPMAKPVVFSICITMSVQVWNQFFIPLIFLQKEGMKTIPLMIVKYTKNLLSTMDLAMAASVMSTVPILILFIIFSERILEGVTSGAVKG